METTLRLIALMPVRNEGWTLGLSLRVALQWCDAVVVLLHACTDDSEDIAMSIADEEPGRVILMREASPAWDEMRHRQAMLSRARYEGATHIAHVDADEILTANLMDHSGPVNKGCICNALLQLCPARIMHLPLYNVRGSLNRYHANGMWGHRVTSVAWMDYDRRLGWTGDRFHAREPQGAPLEPWRPIAQGDGGVLHLWGLSERRLRAKHSLYQVTERLRWPNRCVEMIREQYSWAVYDRRPMTREKWMFAETPESWLLPYQPWIEKHMHSEREPWQETEVRRIVRENPGIAAGLDLFGVI